MAEVYNFSLTATQQAAVRELWMDQFLTNPSIETTHRVMNNVFNGEIIGELGDLSILGIADAGCGSNYDTWTGATKKITWDCKKWKVKRQLCYTDIEASIKAWALDNGINPYDMTGSDYVNFVVTKLGEALDIMIMRLAWFNDTAAAATPVGRITSAGIVANMNILNGFWKQIFTQCIAQPTQLVTLAANAQLTYALQESAFSSTNAYDYLDAMYNKATPDKKILSNSGKVFLVTSSFMNRFKKYLEGKDLPETFRIMQDGIETVAFRGVPVIEMPYWDTIIREDENSGTAWYEPHRAILTYRDNLVLGTTRTSLLTGVEVWYDADSEYNKIRTLGDMYPILLHPERVIACY